MSSAETVFNFGHGETLDVFRYVKSVMSSFAGRHKVSPLETAVFSEETLYHPLFYTSWLSTCTIIHMRANTVSK